MTCIVGVVGKDGKITMGGDSAGSDSSFSLVIRDDPKVFVRGEYVFGFTSSFRMGQLIHHKLKLPQPPDDPEKLYEFMVTEFIDALRKCFKEGGYMKTKDDREEGGTFLVGVRGKLFYIESDNQVGIPNDSFAAVGCGDHLALGSLYTSQGFKDDRNRVKWALEAAERFSAGVRRPFVIEYVKPAKRKKK